MERSTNIDSKKAEERKRFLALRSVLSAPERTRQSKLICERLLTLPELEDRKTLHCFWPMLERDEPDLRPAIASWTQKGRRVALPVITSTTPPEMIQREFLGENHLAQGCWGIPEPDADCPEVPLPKTDAFIIPALAATVNGERLGYGGGFYDAFLPSRAPVVIVPLYEPCLAEHLTTAAHDRNADIVVTPSKTIRVATSSPTEP